MFSGDAGHELVNFPHFVNAHFDAEKEQVFIVMSSDS